MRQGDWRHVASIDLQIVPRVIAKRHVDDMVSPIATTAKEERVDHFRRFDLMRHWHETEHLPFKPAASRWMGCTVTGGRPFRQGLVLLIAEAAERPTTTAIGPTIAPH